MHRGKTDPIWSKVWFRARWRRLWLQCRLTSAGTTSCHTEPRCMRQINFILLALSTHSDWLITCWIEALTGLLLCYLHFLLSGLVINSQICSRWLSYSQVVLLICCGYSRKKNAMITMVTHFCSLKKQNKQTTKNAYTIYIHVCFVYGNLHHEASWEMLYVDKFAFCAAPPSLLCHVQSDWICIT